MELNLRAGSSPHIKSDETTQRIMIDVLIALVPAMFAGVYYFGLNSLYIIITTVLACILSEFILNKSLKMNSTLNDFSATVTGVLLAFNLSPMVPLWLAFVGGVFAITVVKGLFGGLGQNFMNPALGARAFLMASWPSQMTIWQEPKAEIIAYATPLAIVKDDFNFADNLPTYMELFTGNISGCIGETSALALLLGVVYLLYRKVITLEIPLTFIGTVGILTFIFGGNEIFTGDYMYHILAGGLILGAFYMATDYTTSPMSFRGKIIFAIGCGVITSVIRIYGGYPEGVSYSIIIMNLFVPLIDRYFIPISFGGFKNVK